MRKSDRWLSKLYYFSAPFSLPSTLSEGSRRYFSSLDILKISKISKRPALNVLFKGEREEDYEVELDPGEEVSLYLYLYLYLFLYLYLYLYLYLILKIHGLLVGTVCLTGE